MAQPNPYDRDFNFAALAPANVPEVGARLNGELDVIGAVVDQIRDSLAAIQRDDTLLANGSVHPDALSALTRALITGNWIIRGTWLTGTLYRVRDVVVLSGVGYVCLEEHTAGVFLTDSAANKWVDFYSENLTPAIGSITAAMLAPSFSLPFARLGNYLPTGAGAVARSLQSRLDEDIYLTDFGADPSGAVSINTAWAAAVARAEAIGGTLVIPRGTYRADAALAFPAQFARGIRQEGTIVSYLAAAPALVIGTDNATAGAFGQSKVYKGLNIERATQSTWANEAEIGIRFINADNCQIEITRSEKFTIAVQLFGGLRGCEDSRYQLGRLIDCKVGLDLHCATAASWVNSNTYVGGHFANQSATNPLLDRFGVRLSFAVGAYNRHNANNFYGPSFELQRQGTPGTVTAIPFLMEADDARALHASDIRIEACSPFVARHLGGADGGAVDCVYQIGYLGTYGYTGAVIDYAGATRKAGTVTVLHQSGASHYTPRLVAAAEDVRGLAFRNTVAVAGGIGFEGLAVMSGNPAGPPTTLTGFAFGGLDALTLNSGSVTLPTSRALGFVVDTALCQDFVLAVQGTGMRPIVMQFDAAENVIDGGAFPVSFSNMFTVWAGTPSFFSEGNADLDALLGGIEVFRHQRIALSAGCRFAIIGVRGSSGSAVLSAMRLFCSSLQAPRVLRGGGARAWGSRELTTTQAWTVPSLAAGATATLDVTLAGVRGGDYVQAGFAKDTGFQNGGVVFHAVQGGTGSTNQVRVTAHNVSGGAINVADGTAYVRAIRPRL